jgi:hypothetical protein
MRVAVGINGEIGFRRRLKRAVSRWSVSSVILDERRVVGPPHNQVAQHINEAQDQYQSGAEDQDDGDENMHKQSAILVDG